MDCSLWKVKPSGPSRPSNCFFAHRSDSDDEAGTRSGLAKLTSYCYRQRLSASVTLTLLFHFSNLAFRLLSAHEQLPKTITGSPHLQLAGWLLAAFVHKRLFETTTASLTLQQLCCVFLESCSQVRENSPPNTLEPFCCAHARSRSSVSSDKINTTRQTCTEQVLKSASSC
jgi:hypothetical protein